MEISIHVDARSSLDGRRRRSPCLARTNCPSGIVSERPISSFSRLSFAQLRSPSSIQALRPHRSPVKKALWKARSDGGSVNSGLDIEVCESTSALRNVLVRIMMHPLAWSDLILRATDLFALDVRFNDWFLRVAKRSASDVLLETVLEMSDETTSTIESAWTRYSGLEEVRILDKLLLSAIDRFSAAISRVPDSSRTERGND